MKIAVAIPKYGLVGGAENFAFELCERLATHNGFEIHVFANKWRKGNAPIVFHKIPIIRFPRFLQPISFAYFVRNEAKRGRFDLLHSHDRIFGMNLFTMHGIPHKTWIKEVRQKRLSLFDRATAWVEKKGITGPPEPMVLPVSTLVKDELLKRYDIAESRIHVMHPGVSIDRFAQLDRGMCRREVRQRHRLAQDDMVLLFVGMNFEVKRLELVLQGMARLVKDNSNSHLKLLIVGKGDEKRYIRSARNLGISERVVFAGLVRKTEEYYLAADIFVMPSAYDTFGIAVLEAMMAGLPVIITKKVGAKDLLQNSVQGFVLSENPSEYEMVEALASMIDSQRHIQIGQMAKKTALENSWDKLARRIVDLYSTTEQHKGPDLACMIAPLTNKSQSVN
ncbi:MAG: glycosyltransferase family 4 protein [Deltaproteobacteria bacterium]|nr:glycosyltransferase family 4 protein [Deltaproteobacteria bacterium]